MTPQLELWMLLRCDMPFSNHIKSLLIVIALSVVTVFPLVFILIALLTLGTGIHSVTALLNTPLYYAAALPGLWMADGRGGFSWWMIVLFLPIVEAIIPPALSRIASNPNVLSASMMVHFSSKTWGARMGSWELLRWLSPIDPKEQWAHIAN
jgi:hypothetical protein